MYPPIAPSKSPTPPSLLTNVFSWTILEAKEDIDRLLQSRLHLKASLRLCLWSAEYVCLVFAVIGYLNLQQEKPADLKISILTWVIRLLNCPSANMCNSIAVADAFAVVQSRGEPVCSSRWLVGRWVYLLPTDLLYSPPRHGINLHHGAQDSTTRADHVSGAEILSLVHLSQMAAIYSPFKFQYSNQSWKAVLWFMIGIGI